ncbi:MAG: cell wall hydrolase [Geminicoccaceae bacterium]|nr:cell wall hydrolase [Geminicoccaceae bacterium]
MRVGWFAALSLVVAVVALHPARGRANDAQCLATIAVLEAAGEGEAGMRAVMRVVRNRVADRRFPDEVCAVVAQPGQFQPVGEWPALRRALADPSRLDGRRLLGPSAALDVALKLASLGGLADETERALYFVNPLLMDPRHCPWFAGLKRTRAIGRHVFMRHYGKGERRGDPALDCADPAIGSQLGSSMAARYANGLFHPAGARIASRTPTRKQVEAWRRTGQLEARQKQLKKLFKPGWIKLD